MKTNRNTGITFVLSAVCAVLLLNGCNKEGDLISPDFSRQTELLGRQDNPLDKWIADEYTKPYNIEVIWRWDTKEAGYNRNFIPPKESNVKPYLMILKKTFIETYEEVMGKDFIKPLVPKQFHLLGEWGYNSNGTITLAQAESGNKFTFYGVNHWDEKQGNDYPWVREAVHTMFHEFGHILHQNKKFSEDFEQVSKQYYTSNWNNESDLQARIKGFASSYSMLNHNEDFVELIAFYTTLTPEAWNHHIERGIREASAADKEKAEEGLRAIQTKITMVKDYLKSSWGIDLDMIRDLALENAQASYDNPEIFPQSTPSASISSAKVQSPFVHNCTYCNHGAHGHVEK